MGLDLVLFDLDGTLTDPSGDFLLAIRHALDIVGIDAPPEAVLRGYIGPPLLDTIASLGIEGPDVDRAVGAYRDRYRANGSADTRVHDGIPGVLEALRADGVAVGVATSKPAAIAREVLTQTGLDALVDTVAGPDLDESRAAKHEVVSMALGQHRDPDPSRVRMVGDRSFDVVGAAAHGVATIGVLWGFGSADELTGSGAARVVSSARELDDVLRSEMRQEAIG